VVARRPCPRTLRPARLEANIWCRYNNVCSHTGSPVTKEIGGWVAGSSSDPSKTTMTTSHDDDALLERLKLRIREPRSRIDMDTLSSPPLYAPVGPRIVAETEEALRLRLPNLLSRVYCEVANGGFGPGGGLLGLDGGHLSADGLTLVQTYQSFLVGGWPVGLLPLWDWGDAMWSGVDASTVDATIVTHDETGPTGTRFSLQTWLSEWLGDVDLFPEIYELEDAILTNPLTQRPVRRKRRGLAKGL
jgi:hypothetical protein